MQLSLLLNLIIRNYLNQTRCVIHYHDDPVNLVHVNTAPLLMKRIFSGGDFKLDAHQKCRNFLLQCRDARTAFERMELVIKYASRGMYNDRLYIVVVDGEEAFERLFNSYMLLFVRSVLVVYAPDANVDKVSGMMDAYKLDAARADVAANGYDLYTHKYVGARDQNDPIYLETWYAENLSFAYDSHPDLFPDKVSNQRGRELRAFCSALNPYALCWTGISDPPIGSEHNVVVKYAERFNMFLNLYLNSSWNGYGDIDNWTGVGPLGRLLADDDDYADIAYGGFPARDNVDMIRSVIYAYEASAPLPTVQHGFLMFIEVFRFPIWLCIFSLYVSARLLVYARRSLLSQFSNQSRRTRITNATLFGMLINQPAELTADIKQSRFLKFIVTLLLFSSVLLVTAYNSRLSSVMVKPILENNIDTLAELASSDLKLLFFDDYFWTLSEDERSVYRTLYKKIVLIPNNTDFELSEKWISSRKYAIARYRRTSGEYFEAREHLQQMRGKFKPVAPELFSDSYYLLLKKNSMHTYEMQKLVHSAEEAGLMKFWEEHALRFEENMLFQKMIQDVAMDKPNIILNLKHLKGLFAFWAGALLLSSIVFLWEICTGKRNYSVYEYYN